MSKKRIKILIEDIEDYEKGQIEFNTYTPIDNLEVLEKIKQFAGVQEGPALYLEENFGEEQKEYISIEGKSIEGKNDFVDFVFIIIKIGIIFTLGFFTCFYLI